MEYNFTANTVLVFESLEKGLLFKVNKKDKEMENTIKARFKMEFVCRGVVFNSVF